MRVKNPNNDWLVQIGLGDKGSYRTRYSLETEHEAVFWFNGINIGNGFKKRLVDPDGNVIARVFS